MGSKKGQKIKITGEEFCEVVSNIILEYRNRIISDDAIYLGLGLNDETANKFMLETCVVMANIAIRLFKIKHSNEKIVSFTTMTILEKTGKQVFKLKKKEQEQFENLYFEKAQFFDKIAPAGKTSYDIRSQWLGFSRYLISEFSDKEEDDNQELIQKFSAHIVEFSDITAKFMASSRINVASAFSGKYEFVITK